MHYQILSLISLLPLVFTHPTVSDAYTQHTTSKVTARDSAVCNNSPALCSKTYDSITYLGAHDSPFVRDASTSFSTSGNQFFNSTVQLDAGVRLLTAQVHNSNGDLHLCHTSCDLLDAGTLESWLAEIKSWLDSNPTDVVTILLINSDNTPSADLHQRFKNAQITKYTYTPPSTSKPPAPNSWPTLQSLITADQRLVTFVASLADTPSSEASYLLQEFNFIFENPFSNTAFSDFVCTPDRPNSVKGNSASAISANFLPLMNHFLDVQQVFGIQIPNVGNITTTNNPATTPSGTLGAAAAQCATEYGRNPSFLLVDFFDKGPAIQVADTLNGVTDPIGRKAVPSGSNGADGGRAESTFGGVRALNTQVKDGKQVKIGAWIWAAGKWSWGGIDLNGGQVVG